jgi:putative membrane-bound dehydrogenase-like protein
VINEKQSPGVYRRTAPASHQLETAPALGQALVVSRYFLPLLAVLAAVPTALSGTNPGGVGPQAAANSITNLTTNPDLQVSLFASEPMLRNPTDMDIDERGRVWITEGVNYRSSFKPWGTLDPAGDRVVILEDANGDGRAQKETVFYQDPSINSALGICVLGNRVIISDSPNVFVLTDTDGDGKADKRELLFTGISGFDHDHGVHAFTFGPDGKLYFNMGNEGKQLFRPLKKEIPLHGIITNSPMEPVIDLEGNRVAMAQKLSAQHPYTMGMVFRCNPDGSEVETLAWNFRNNYEVAVDSFGTLWQSDNDDDGNQGVRINYVMEYGNFGYADETTGASWREGWDKARSRGATEASKVLYEWHQFDPGVVPNLLHTGAGSPTGIAVYEGKLLPEPFRNQLIHCDAGPRLVRSYIIRAAGAGYEAIATNLLSSKNTWFRPSDVCVAPDGSIYVADWNDAGVGGHNMADQKPGQMTGRIFRLCPKSSTMMRSVPPRFDTAAQCVAALQSPNLSARYLAWTKLNTMQGQAESELAQIWKAGEPRMRGRALQLLARIKGKESDYIRQAGLDSDSDVRIAGLRIARALKTDVIPLVSKLVSDPSPQVRRECAIALRHNASPQAAGTWAELAEQYDGHDRWYLEALGIGADRQWDPFLEAWLKRAGDKWNSPAGREIVWRSRALRTSELLATIVSDPNLSEKDRGHFFRSFDFQSGSEKQAALVGLVDRPGISPGTLVLEVLSRLRPADEEPKPELQKAVAKALEQVKDTPQFVEIIRDFRIRDHEGALLNYVLKHPSEPVSTEAIRLLLRHGHLDPVRKQLAGPASADLVRLLGSTAENEAVPLLTPIVSDPAREPALRKEALRGLARTQPGASALLKMARENQLPDDLKLLAASELNNVRWKRIQAEAAAVLPLPRSAESEPLPPVAELARRTGDPIKGAAVFRRDAIACIKCHQVNGEGTDFGPNLSDIGTKLGKDALYESILNPSAGISFGYEAWQVHLKNGEDAYGLIASETDQELAIKAVGGLVTRYRKTGIVSRTQQKLSIMPANLQQTMRTQELVDLVEYLASLKTVRASR